MTSVRPAKSATSRAPKRPNFGEVTKSPVIRRPRPRELGIVIGDYPTGKWNAITDVPGVRVGHSTIIKGHGELRQGKGPVRTGVTAILPNDGNIFDQRVVGSGFILNGAGEIAGLTQVMEWGLIETPICLTSTLSVGAVSESVVKYMVDRYPTIGDRHDVIIPVVGECDDSWLSDAAGRHIKAKHVYSAIDSASSGPIAEGSVGGGTGMVTCDFKGGIGTASRKLPAEQGGFVLGALVMSNFGVMRDLRVGGLPIGELLAPEFEKLERREYSYGSIITVLATNAPLASHQLGRLCKRAALGVGRAGSCAHHGSGEIIIAFSTANTVPRETKKMVYRMDVLLDHAINPLYRAAIEATEEAILNSLCAAETMVGRSGNTAHGLPVERVVALAKHWPPPMPTT